MAGTIKGGRKAAATNKRIYGKDFYKRIGQMGGLTPKTKPAGFAARRDIARSAGRIGGSISRRGPAELYAVR